MGNAIAFARRSIAIETDRALAVEMGRRPILVQIREHGNERVTALQHIARHGRAAIHVDMERRILGEERHLPARVAPVGAASIGVD
jgi:hypothetical protein